MTDTTAWTGSEGFGNTEGRRGMSIGRIYTTEGEHPYDQVNWEYRDVVQTNWKNGEVIFEQRGAEFPDFWSVNASTIVTTKYFRGAQGTPEREYSLRQLINRVVLTYTQAGRDHGYFATEEDATIFEHELTYMLLHQVFSFNSPVWFNVGTVSPQQVSACFILSVDDSMDSILNWYREEGMIFKGGSGAGLNLSRIRSSKELLKGSGGSASGPVSFMRGADASAGTIKSGGATRRAAKMVVLDVDHPDIIEFVETKEKEEEKIRVLRDAGYDMELGGKDINSVQYQNANNSVRVNAEFMNAVEHGLKFGLRARTTGEVIEEVEARDLWNSIAQAAWACAMDISICFADFPTEKIGETTRAYRQLGIGYANLGALLMAIGVPYDSREGFALAAAITSLMTGAAYRRSAELAAVVGPYEGYSRNKAGHDRVMSKHEQASLTLQSASPIDAPVIAAANAQWALNTAIGANNGWRNAQASLLAPTGTIGFMMDCDTTGIEPDFSLVKYKKLSTGGSMQIVNQTIPFALDRLGYAHETVEAIVAHIGQHGHVVDAPGLKLEHYAIFDTAVGVRAIEPMGHVRMMAAVQPFLSGAISKTVNMPETATQEEIADVYFQGWKLGLKALAIYRDNCKVGQPLSDAKAKTETKTAETPVVVSELSHPVRKRLPKSRPSSTTSFTVGGAEGYMTASSYPDGGLGEVFLKLGKQGSTLAGVMDAFSISVSIGLQYGVPLETFVQKFTNVNFEPAGMTDDKDIRIAKSLMDYIFRRLALDYLPFETRSALGIFSAAERSASLDAGGGSYAAISELPQVIEIPTPVAEVAPAPVAEAAPVIVEITRKEVHSSAELFELLQGKESDAPLCFNCGIKMRPSGSCHVCEGCGSTSGCS